MKIHEAQQINYLLSLLKASKLSTEDFINLLELKEQVSKACDKQDKDLIELMKAYNVAPTQTQTGTAYEFTKHEQADEIKEKLQALGEREVEVTKVKFMSIAAFAEAAKEVDMNLILKLKEVLVK
jgi:hypothetical protein